MKKSIYLLILISLFNISRLTSQNIGLERFYDEYCSKKVTSNDKSSASEKIAGTPYLVKEFEEGKIYMKQNDIYSVPLRFNIYENKKQKDIAEIMNLPQGTVATLISRGKKHLKEKLKNFF